MTRTCTDCDKPICRTNRSGYCKPCCVMHNFHSGENAAKRKANATAAVQSAEHRQRQSRNAIRMHADRRDDAEWQARLKRQGAALRFHPTYEESWRAGRKRGIEQGYAWCPPEFREAYATLRKKVGAAEAKALVMIDVERAERERVASLSPFQRQEERLRKGASVVAKFNPRRADPSYTLGGVVGAIA